MSQSLALVTLATVTLAGCSTVERVRTAVNAVTPIRSAPEPVRSPITYICDANEATRTWECQTTRTSDGAVIDVPASPEGADTAPDPQSARTEPARTPARAPATISAPANEILASPADAFAVQLIALNDERALVAYATEQGIARPIYAQTRAGDDALFVLLLGIYPDRNAADAALADFVADRTLAASPWVRPLAPLQQTVRDLRAR